MGKRRLMAKQIKLKPGDEPKNRGGRPPFPGDTREQLVQFYVTKRDATTLRILATAAGLRGVGTVLCALVEPIVQGGFSVVSAGRSVVRLQRLVQKRSGGRSFAPAVSALFEGVRDLFAPPPPIPDEPEDLLKLRDDMRAALAELESEIARASKKKETKVC
jgi:hypothetical protein